MNANPSSTITSYIESFSGETKMKLLQMHKLINDLIPKASETIKYQMPTFVYKGKNLVHFAGYKHHIGFYPTPSPIEEFVQELKPYKYSKGAVQFPVDKPLPVDLIKRMVAYHVKQLDKTTK